MGALSPIFVSLLHKNIIDQHDDMLIWDNYIQSLPNIYWVLGS